MAMSQMEEDLEERHYIQRNLGTMAFVTAPSKLIMASPSLTPSEENHRNQETEESCIVLNKAMGKAEQTYEQFMEGFIFLKPGDLMKKKPAQSEKKLESQSVNRAEAVCKPAANVQDSQQISTQQEEIEEEILVEGSISSRMNVSTAVKTGALVKFDNFVDAEEMDDDVDTDYTMTEYDASFTSADNRVCQSTASAITSANTTNSTSADPQEMLQAALSSTDNLTDKLLSNFLADLQNESNQEANTKQVNTTAENNDDIEQFLKKRKNQGAVTDDGVNFNDNDSDAALTLLDQSEDQGVKVTIKPGEMHGIAMEDNKTGEDKRRATVYRESLMDSEGNIVVVGRNDAGDCSVSDDGAVQGELMFPGEVPVMEEVEKLKNETILDFKATMRDPSSVTTTGDDTEMSVCHNEVEPFSLDKDFDYDNVVLTPKYSTEDLKELRT